MLETAQILERFNMSELSQAIYYKSSDVKREVQQINDIVDYLVYESDIDKISVLEPIVHKAYVEIAALMRDADGQSLV
jgi:hypothetical protein